MVTVLFNHAQIILLIYISNQLLEAFNHYQFAGYINDQGQIEEENNFDIATKETIKNLIISNSEDVCEDFSKGACEVYSHHFLYSLLICLRFIDQPFKMNPGKNVGFKLSTNSNTYCEGFEYFTDCSVIDKTNGSIVLNIKCNPKDSPNSFTKDLEQSSAQVMHSHSFISGLRNVAEVLPKSSPNFDI